MHRKYKLFFEKDTSTTLVENATAVAIAKLNYTIHPKYSLKKCFILYYIYSNTVCTQSLMFKDNQKCSFLFDDLILEALNNATTKVRNPFV